jgi:hypothetical protein
VLPAGGLELGCCVASHNTQALCKQTVTVMQPARDRRREYAAGKITH